MLEKSIRTTCEAPHRRSPAWTWIRRGTLMLYQKQRTPGSVKVRTGGYSPRPGRFQRPVDQVEFLDRRLKSGWEAVRGGRAFVRAAVCFGASFGTCRPMRLAPGVAVRSFCRHRQAPESVPHEAGGPGKCSPESSKSWVRSPPSKFSTTPPVSVCVAPSSRRAHSTATPSP